MCNKGNDVLNGHKATMWLRKRTTMWPAAKRATKNESNNTVEEVKEYV
jgi:hypothetical protein